MTDIWLVRHGEASASWDQSADPGLSALGQRQAEAVADTLASRVPTDCVLLSSPKARARETGEPFARRRGRELIEAPAFIEVQAPVPLSERKRWLGEFMSQGWAEQPASLWGWRDEIVNALGRCTEPTVIFSHFLVINAALAEVSGDDPVLQYWPANGSIHHFAIEKGELVLRQLGDAMESIVT